MIEDRELRERIERTLAQDPRVDATYVGVCASAGAVILSGHVPSHADARALSLAVLRIDGVRAVADDVVVRLPGAAHHEDGDVATRIARWLVCDPEADEAASGATHDVTASVRDSVVTLRGTVASEERRRYLAARVSKMDGVRALSNQITLAGRPDPLAIGERIEAAFVDDARTRARRIRVSVDGDEVALEGYAGGWRERQMAVRAARSAPGVARVLEHVDTVRESDDHAAGEDPAHVEP